jgi:Holliday junction resolvase
MNDIADRHEKAIAMALMGQRVSGSGSQWHSKGDVITDTELVECKATRSKSYSVGVDRWNKITDEATTVGREPVMAVRLADVNRKPVDLIVITLDRYMELTNR